ncbi:MAG: membrane protein insertion efficiency factor YidD [Ruminococcus sp.]|nr:membrane protein insertion efficiency factor YidD [Ruminococcus sp.]
MKSVLISFVKFYRKHISPHFPARCKYYPTCSKYAIDAIEKFGAFKGSLLAIWRILRCNKWSMGGIDFVPEKFTFKVEKYNYYSQDSADEAADSNNNDSENDERYKN